MVVGGAAGRRPEPAYDVRASVIRFAGRALSPPAVPAVEWVVDALCAHG
jgi:hypothetical protein